MKNLKDEKMSFLEESFAFTASTPVQPSKLNRTNKHISSSTNVSTYEAETCWRSHGALMESSLIIDW